MSFALAGATARGDMSTSIAIAGDQTQPQLRPPDACLRDRWPAFLRLRLHITVERTEDLLDDPIADETIAGRSKQVM